MKELGEAAGGSLVAGIIDRVRKVFGSDARSVDALDRTQGGDPGAVAELASALAWYARQNQAFAQELAGWGAQAGTGSVTQQVHAGRDAYVAARDQTVTNYRQPGELDGRRVVSGEGAGHDPQMRRDTGASRELQARRDTGTDRDPQATQDIGADRDPQFGRT